MNALVSCLREKVIKLLAYREEASLKAIFDILVPIEKGCFLYKQASLITSHNFYKYPFLSSALDAVSFVKRWSRPDESLHLKLELEVSSTMYTKKHHTAQVNDHLNVCSTAMHFVWSERLPTKSRPISSWWWKLNSTWNWRVQMWAFLKCVLYFGPSTETRLVWYLCELILAQTWK